MVEALNTRREQRRGRRRRLRRGPGFRRMWVSGDAVSLTNVRPGGGALGSERLLLSDFDATPFT